MVRLIFASFQLKEARCEQMKWQIESVTRTDLARFFVWTGDGFARAEINFYDGRKCVNSPLVNEVLDKG
jgi:hypothetical protein